MKSEWIQIKRKKSKRNKWRLYLRLPSYIVNKIVSLYHTNIAWLFSWVYWIDLIDNINTKSNKMSRCRWLYSTTNPKIFDVKRNNYFFHYDYIVSVYMILFFIEHKNVIEWIKKWEIKSESLKQKEKKEKTDEKKLEEKIKRMEEKLWRKVLDAEWNFI